MEKPPGIRILRGFSIKKRLPLLIGALLFSVMITFGVISFLSVRKAALRSGRERLHSWSIQLGNMFEESGQLLINLNRAIANHPAVLTILSNSNADTVMLAIQQLHQTTSLDTSTALVEIISPTLNSVFRSGNPSLSYRSVFPNATGVDTGRIGKLQSVENRLYYPVSSPVREKGKLKGYLVQWKRVASSARTFEKIGELMGTKAKLYIGNSDGSIWTDLYHQLSYPAKNPAINNGILEYRDDHGTRFLGIVQTLPASNWNLLIETPRQTILSSSMSFLRNAILIGSLLVGIGILVGWLMSRNLTSPLNKLTAAASAIASGDVAGDIDLDRRDELGKLARAFNTMSIKIARAKKDLEQQVNEKGEMNEQLHELSAHLLKVREEERVHIAREMHDELGQFLTGLKMDISWINKKLVAGATEEDTLQKKAKLNEMASMIDDAIVFVRKLSAELRPSILDDLGLVAAMEWHSKEFTRRFNIPVSIEVSHAELQVPEDIAVGMFRMYQESLTNVARHAEAKTVITTLMKTGNELQLSITDDGKGFEPGSGNKKTLGLLGIRERAAMIGGTVEIDSTPGKGTTILITGVNIPG